MKNIFGDKTEDMLRVFASYQGTNEYAVEARVEAKEWLREIASTVVDPKADGSEPV